MMFAMNVLRICRRCPAPIAVVAAPAKSCTLPCPPVIRVLEAVGGRLLCEGWHVWRRAGGFPTRRNVTYVRGQRIEVGAPRSMHASPGAVQH